MRDLDIALEGRTREQKRLRVSGRLRPGWCGNLSTGLAHRDVDIVRGHAVTVAAGMWRGEFELRCKSGQELTLDEVGRMLETEAAAGFTSPIDLLHHRLEYTTTCGGCLLLEVEALDRVGLLAALLRRLAYHALFPVELRLETIDGVARDRLWLRGGGNSAPSLRTERAVKAGLDSLVRRPDRPASLR